MTNISLIAIIWIWTCAVYGQIPVNEFDPYHSYYVPYASSFVNQPSTRPKNYGAAAQLGGSDEFKRTPLNIKNLFLQGVMSIKIKQLEATVANLASKLTGEVTQADLDLTNANVSKLSAALAVTNAALAMKADQTDLVQTKKDVSNLKKALDETIIILDSKASQADLDNTNVEVSRLSDALTETNGNLETIQADLETAKNDILDLKELTKTNSIGRIPASCLDLQSIGYVKSGIYSILVENQVQNVNCDFTQPSDGAAFQTLIGTVDVKSTPVYFYAHKTSGFSTVSSAIPFESIEPDVGGFLSLAGTFTAPTAGKYYFAFSGISDADGVTRVDLQVNGAAVGEAYAEAAAQTLTLHATLQLSMDDTVELVLVEGAIREDENKYTNFVGWLIEEELTI